LIIARPTSIEKTVQSVAVFAIQAVSEQRLKSAMTLLQWDSAWLEVLYLRS
jgi:hypothetical protein